MGLLVSLLRSSATHLKRPSPRKSEILFVDASGSGLQDWTPFFSDLETKLHANVTLATVSQPLRKTYDLICIRAPELSCKNDFDAKGLQKVMERWKHDYPRTLVIPILTVADSDVQLQEVSEPYAVLHKGRYAWFPFERDSLYRKMLKQVHDWLLI